MNPELVFIGIWMAIGALTYFVLASKGEVGGDDFSLFIIFLFGPFILLVILVKKMIPQKDDVSTVREVKEKSTTRTATDKDAPPKDKSDDDFFFENETLIEELSSIFVVTELTSSKSDFVRLQRLGTLSLKESTNLSPFIAMICNSINPDHQ